MCVCVRVWEVATYEKGRGGLDTGGCVVTLFSFINFCVCELFNTNIIMIISKQICFPDN